MLARDGAAAKGADITVVLRLRGVTDFACFAGPFAPDRVGVAVFAVAFFTTFFFEALVAGCFLAARLTVFFFIAFLVFFGARAFVVVLTFFVLRFPVFRTPALLLRVFATDTRPAAAARRDLPVRDFLLGFFLAGATTNSL
ncbi:MAG: hypothetical protein NTAFB05_11980 [Nitrobacter sp.]|uniref:hypothetical protein n=1 Tax=Nitrobacter sp. TaxID=29420 RepID=UPI00387DD9CB